MFQLKVSCCSGYGWGSLGITTQRTCQHTKGNFNFDQHNRFVRCCPI